MADLRFTLLPDGPSDRALIPILAWLLRAKTKDRAIQAELGDLRRLREPPRNLAERILTVLDLYPCDLLFIHRDSEVPNSDDRYREIEKALADANMGQNEVAVVPVVPIRMQEAWLLFDETAIRRAAGNPNGREDLRLPHIQRVETLPDPKELLYDLLRDASGLNGRRRARFPAHKYAPQVSSFIEDFSPLRGLPAFRSLEQELMNVVESKGWNTRRRNG